MALSDLIKKIEDSPRSTKVAVCSVAFGVAAGAFALYTIVNQPERMPEPASAPKFAAETSSNAQPVPAPAAPQPTLPPVPTETPSLIPTSTPLPSPTPEPSETAVEKPTPNPTATRAPVATPTPEVNDYYVVMHQGFDPDDNRGVIGYYASYPFHKNVNGGIDLFRNESFYLNYLEVEKIITSEQKNAYHHGETIEIPLLSIANASYKLGRTDNYNLRKLNLREPDYLLHYADKSSMDSNENASTDKSFQKVTTVGMS